MGCRQSAVRVSRYVCGLIERFANCQLGVTENYYFGLWLTLTSFLSDLDTSNADMLQHWVSIRSSVLTNQEKNSSTTADGPFFGWTSQVGNNGSLINTESVSTNVLGDDLLLIFD